MNNSGLFQETSDSTPSTDFNEMKAVQYYLLEERKRKFYEPLKSNWSGVLNACRISAIENKVDIEEEWKMAIWES